MPELPAQPIPPPELPTRNLPPPELPSQALPIPELPIEAPPLPPRPNQNRANSENHCPVENEEDQQNLLKLSSPTGVELPAEDVVLSFDLEAKISEAARPVELPITRDSDDLGIATDAPALASEHERSQAGQPETLEAAIEPPTVEVMDRPRTTRDSPKPQSTYSDLYESSVKSLRINGIPTPQAAHSAGDAEVSTVAATEEPEGGRIGDSVIKPLRIRSADVPPATDSVSYISSVRAPGVPGSPLKALDRDNDTLNSTSRREDESESFPSKWPINGLSISKDEAIPTESGDVDLSSSQSSPAVTEIAAGGFKSPLNDLPTSHSGGDKAAEGPIPTISLEVEAPDHEYEDPPSNVDGKDFETNLERQIDDQLRELQGNAEKEISPPLPTRLPPLPPSPSPPVTQSAEFLDLRPKQSIDSVASGLRRSGASSRSSQDHISSLGRINSDISFVSQGDHSTTRSSPTTIGSDTIDTVMTTDTQGSLRGQAQNELRHLQSQLSEAKRRGDTHTAKASIQRSIELIQRTYLSGSAVGESSANTENTGKLGPNRKSVMRLPSFSNLVNTKNSALIEAASAGDLPRLATLLEEKVNVNARGENYRTAQMAAAIHGHLDCLGLLKNYAADEFAIDGQGRTVIHVAVMANRLEVVKWLLGAYPPASPQAPKSWRLFRAAHAVKEMISHKVLREVSDAEGSKALHLAVKLNLKGMVDLLLAAGADVESKNNWGRTPLHEAVISNLPGIAQILIAAGAKVEAGDAELMTPLHLASKLNHKESIALLLGNNVHRYSYDHNGDLAIHVAARQGNLSAIEALITDRTDLGRTTKPGETLLHIACLTNGLMLADYLVKNTVDVNPWARPQQTHHGLTGSVLPSSQESKRTSTLPQTPLHYACTAGLFEMSVLLIDHGAWINATPDDGKTPLMMAVEAGNTNLACLLLEKGAKVNAAMPGSCLTAMHISARKGDLETTQQLFRHGANMMARTSDSRTPWEYSVTKIKDKDKRKEIDDYFRKINEVRIYNAKRQRQAIAQRTSSQLESTLGGTTNPGTQAVGGYRPYAGTGPPQFIAWEQSQLSLDPTPQTVYPQQYPDANDSFPEALPAYTPGPSAPQNLVNRAPVHRPQSG